MALTAGQMQTLILAELEATGADLTALSGQFAVLWELYSAKGYVSGRLQYLYTRRHAINFLMGRHWQDVTVQDAGTNQADSDLVKNLNTLLAQTNIEIAEVEKQAAGGVTPQVGAITAVTPVGVTSGYDPNSRGYRGDPLVRS